MSASLEIVPGPPRCSELACTQPLVVDNHTGQRCAGDHFVSAKQLAGQATEAAAFFAAGPKLRFLTARQACEEAPEEVDWLAKPWIAKGAITEVAGKIKAAGKTTWLLALCRQVLDGQPFMQAPTRRTGVIFLTEQSSVSFRESLQRADLVSRDDFVLAYWHGAAGVPWPEMVARSAKEARSRGFDLLVVDTLGQFAGLAGDAENSAGAALEAMQPLQAAAAQDGLAVAIARHERKSGGDVGDSGRGSSAFTGAVDIVLSIRRAEGHSRPNVRIIHTLSRFTETPPELVVEYVDGKFVSLGTEQAVQTAEARARLLDVLPTSADDAQPVKALVEATGSARWSILATLEELAALGGVRRVGAGKRNDAFRYWRPGPFVSVGPRDVVPTETNLTLGLDPASDNGTEETEGVSVVLLDTEKVSVETTHIGPTETKAAPGYTCIDCGRDRAGGADGRCRVCTKKRAAQFDQKYPE